MGTPSDARHGSAWNADAARLFLCGLCILFWELALIRWLGATIRIVAYFSNLVLISAFFGLGAGALLTRFRWRLERLIAPLLAASVLLGAWLDGVWHASPAGGEYIWIGAPAGVLDAAIGSRASARVLLLVVYSLTAAVFAAFGQYVGRLFRTHPPLRAYSFEVLGSLAGILLFALLSRLQAPPAAWFATGTLLLVAALPWRLGDAAVALVAGTLAVAAAGADSARHSWSPYYRIAVEPLTQILDVASGQRVPLDRTRGHVVAVNNDYHQMMLDLRPSAGEHPFVTGWRTFYDAPYDTRLGELPPGRILVVGAGTGNDVAAALRRTDRPVTAVEIDPAIAALGRRLHAERPYDDPRVSLVVDDARSYFHRARTGEYAAVVFGFLDSHRLLSAFSSVRLDNFIYTEESMREVRRLLAPGGRVALSFASNTPWIHERLSKLVERSFARSSWLREPTGYANGIIYVGVREPGEPEASPRPATVPSDDWPFLYLEARRVPPHNVSFVLAAIALSGAAFLLLPRGERRLRLPYLLLGAAFFLLETSNVVRMALLFGSTWWVNTIVFAGILALVLLANLTAARVDVPLSVSVGALAALILLAAVLPGDALLGLPQFARAVTAVVVYLGPIYFGGLIFARLIQHEERLYEAYGSNVLGAVLGGCAEYLSLVYGFRFLLALALVAYLLVFVLARRGAAPAVSRAA
jgi:SAM-dependent methyltransferase